MSKFGLGFHQLSASTMDSILSASSSLQSPSLTVLPLSFSSIIELFNELAIALKFIVFILAKHI